VHESPEPPKHEYALPAAPLLSPLCHVATLNPTRAYIHTNTRVRHTGPPPTPHKYRTKATSEHGGVVVGTRGSLVARRGANNARAHPAAAAADPATGLDEGGLSAANAGTPHTPSRRDTPSLGDDSPPPLRCSPIMMTTTTTMRHNNNNNNGGTHCRSSCLAGDNADGPCAAGKRSSQQIAMTAQGGVALPEVRRPRTRCGGWCRKKKTTHVGATRPSCPCVASTTAD
jgi:hypothetical protein